MDHTSLDHMMTTQYKIKSLKSLERYGRNGHLLVQVNWHASWEPSTSASPSQLQQYLQTKQSKYIIGDRVTRLEESKESRQILVQWPDEVTTVQKLIKEYGEDVLDHKMYHNLSLTQPRQSRKRKRKQADRFDGGSLMASAHKRWCNVTHLQCIRKHVANTDAIDIVLDAGTGYTSKLYQEQQFARGCLLAVNNNANVMKAMVNTRLSNLDAAQQTFGFGDLHEYMRVFKNIRSVWFDFCDTYNSKNRQCIAASYIHRAWADVFVCSFTFCLRTGRRSHTVKKEELPLELKNMALSHGYILTLKSQKVYGTPPMWFGCFVGERKY